MANFDSCHRRSEQQSNYNSQDPDVIYRHSGISGEDSPNGQVTHETLPVVYQSTLEVSPIIGQKNTVFRNFEKTSNMVEKPEKCAERLSPSCRRTQSPVVYRCFGQGLGCSFERPDSQWTVVGHRSKFAYKHPGIEGSVFGNKVIPDPSFESKGLGGLRQCNGGSLPQQTRGDSLTGDVSHDLASDGFLQPQGNFDKGSSYPRVSECDRKQSVSQGQDYLHRMVPSSQDFSGNLPNLAQTNGRYVCH